MSSPEAVVMSESGKEASPKKQVPEETPVEVKEEKKETVKEIPMETEGGSPDVSDRDVEVNTTNTNGIVIEKTPPKEEEKAKNGEDKGDAVSSGDAGSANDNEDDDGEKTSPGDATKKQNASETAAERKKRRPRKKKAEKGDKAATKDNESDKDGKEKEVVEKEKKSESSTKKKKGEEQAKEGKEGKAGKKGKGKGKGKGKNSWLETGTCKWFDAQKGFGFISSDWNGEEIFAHNTEICSEGFRTLYEGEKVQFTTILEDKRKKATNITGLNGGPIRPNHVAKGGNSQFTAYPGSYGPPKGSSFSAKGGIKKTDADGFPSVVGAGKGIPGGAPIIVRQPYGNGIYELSRPNAQNGQPYAAARHPQYPLPNVPNPYLDQMMMQWMVQNQAQAAWAGLGNPWFPHGPHRW